VIDAIRQASSREGEAPAEPFLEPATHGELRAVMGNYFAHLIGHRLRMSESLGGLAKQ
jgi:hypothetical protein